MKEEIEKLKHGERYIIPESDYGKAEVYRLNDRYVLFGIPMYGGEPWYAGTFNFRKLDELLDMVNSWT